MKTKQEAESFLVEARKEIRALQSELGRPGRSQASRAETKERMRAVETEIDSVKLWLKNENEKNGHKPSVQRNKFICETAAMVFASSDMTVEEATESSLELTEYLEAYGYAYWSNK